jgi:hypothetical protein
VLRRCLRACGIIAFLLVAIAAVVLVGYPTASLVLKRATVVDLIDHASSIELVHFHGDGKGSEIPYATKTLTPGEFRDVRKAFPLGLDTAMPGWVNFCGFDPHHKIIVTSPDGRTTVIRACFICDAWQIGDGPVLRTPLPWMTSLRGFFAREGMPNKTLDEYVHDTYHPTETSH